MEVVLQRQRLGSSSTGRALLCAGSWTRDFLRPFPPKVFCDPVKKSNFLIQYTKKPQEQPYKTRLKIYLEQDTDSNRPKEDS